MNHESNGLYIQIFSPHGLIKFHDAEIGRDRDTGGQVKYVIELLDHISKHPSVRKVDLFTRRIDDKKVSSAYAESIEIINDKARIIRINCGGPFYKAKEKLWKHLDEFIDRTIHFIKQQNDIPDIVHGHYADGNYIASSISKMFNIPFIATGHSLGRNKKKILLEDGWDEKKLIEKFNIQHRISIEENILLEADAIIVSTQHEIDTQYQDYQNKSHAKFTVIPPGVNNDIFYPFYRIGMPGFTVSPEQEDAHYRVNAEIERFLFDPHKPLILSIGRPDKRKNFQTIISCYGADKELQAMANLAIFAGVRKDISQMPDEEKDILTNLLLLMDKYDLYGKMALPKKNDPIREVPEIYRTAARKKGVFINATPGENFGLTIVEAAACGLPVIASPSGGPKEIIEQAQNGILVDVNQPENISNALKTIISNSELWHQYSSHSVKAGLENYSWTEHVSKYVQLIYSLIQQRKNRESSYNTSTISIGKKLKKAETFFISDLDGTLIDGQNDEGLTELLSELKKKGDRFIFGISTGRNKSLTQEAMNLFPLNHADIIICSVGTEIYYTKDFIPDTGWNRHIQYQWKRSEVKALMDALPFLTLQEKPAQTEMKLSYYIDQSATPADIKTIYNQISNSKLKANVVITDFTHLDIIPIRAGKGNALQYLSYKWQIPLEQFITSGNGGNDISMLQGRAMGIVVSNYSPELNTLKRAHNVYFSSHPTARGVLDGIKHYENKINQSKAKQNAEKTNSH